MADLTRDKGFEKKVCPRCGATFECGARAGTGCWCAELPRLTAPIPGGDCLCPDCLKAALAAQPTDRASG